MTEQRKPPAKETPRPTKTRRPSGAPPEPTSKASAPPKEAPPRAARPTALHARLADEVHGLLVEGVKLSEHLGKSDTAGFSAGYQGWYTAARVAVARLAPERLDEFVELYKPKKEPTQLDFTNYGIYYFLIGVSWGGNTNPAGTTLNRFLQQLTILKSIERRLDSVFANVRELLQAELFDTELDAARELLKGGHVRAAGAVTGVVIERHLAEVCGAHAVSIAKRDPHISDLNDRLREENVIPLATWRRIQWMGDIRNLSVHKKDRDPERDEVERLIADTDWLIKNVS